MELWVWKLEMAVKGTNEEAERGKMRIVFNNNHIVMRERKGRRIFQIWEKNMNNLLIIKLDVKAINQIYQHKGKSK